VDQLAVCATYTGGRPDGSTYDGSYRSRPRTIVSTRTRRTSPASTTCCSLPRSTGHRVARPRETGATSPS
jgi:hypothetical protein